MAAKAEFQIIRVVEATFRFSAILLKNSFFNRIEKILAA